MSFFVGQRVEVLGVEPGFENSYYASKVMGVHDDILDVQFEEFLGDDKLPLREMVDLELVRSYPRSISVEEFHIGELVYVWYEGGWWKGMYVGRDLQRRRENWKVFFDYMEEGNKYSCYRKKHIRIHQEWRAGENNMNGWAYLTLDEDMTLDDEDDDIDLIW